MVWLLAKLMLLQRVRSLPALLRAFDAAPGGCAPAVPLRRLVWLSRVLLTRTHHTDFCLPQSLVLFHFLRKWDAPVQIHVGVRRRGDALAGHAWLTLAGRPVVEARDPASVYATTFSYPSNSQQKR